LISVRIATGGDRNVYRYGEDQVLKISTLSFLTQNRLHAKLLRDYQISKSYLPDYIVDTKDATPDSGGHAEIQPYIEGPSLHKKHCADPLIRSQLQTISDTIDRMVAQGLPMLDLVGNAGMFRSTLSNIIVDKHNRLRIIDSTLLEGKSAPPLGYVLELFLPVIRARQRYLVNKFLATR
jgi:hypothetical protein